MHAACNHGCFELVEYTACTAEVSPCLRAPPGCLVKDAAASTHCSQGDAPPAPTPHPPRVPLGVQDPVPLDKFDDWIQCSVPGIKADLTGEPRCVAPTQWVVRQQQPTAVAGARCI